MTLQLWATGSGPDRAPRVSRYRYTRKAAGRGQRDDLDPWNEAGCTQHLQAPELSEPPLLPLACDLGL